MKTQISKPTRERASYTEEGQVVEAWYNATDPANSYNGCSRLGYFDYDALGSRRNWNYVASRGQWLTFTRKDTGLNEYRSWSPSIINYDDDITGTAGNGVTVAEGSFSADYNALNQPRWFWSGNVAGGFVSFGYDPLGRCVKRWNGGASDPAANPAIYFYYEGWSLLQEGSSAAVASRNYIHGARVDEIVKQITPNNWWERYFHYDARGHCALQTDIWGNVVERYEYDAFGYPYFYDGNGTSMTSSSWGNRFLFTGREWLGNLEIYDYRNRMYQPELGRFLQPDPKQFAAGDYNLYRYCHNDPVNRIDPTGLQDDISSKPNLTVTGQGDWMQAGSAYTNGDRLSAAKNYIGEITRDVQKALDTANKNSRFVRWSASINNLQRSASNFSPGTTAKTELNTKSTAVRDGGSVASFRINLQVNISWNESKSASFGLALRTDIFGPFDKTGEIAHTRDAAFALHHQYGRSQSAVAIANEEASSMVGHDMSAADASTRMDTALRPWVDAWWAESKKRDYSGEHTY